MALFSGIELKAKINSIIEKIHIGKDTTNNFKIGSIKINANTEASPFVGDIKEVCEKQIESYIKDEVVFTRIDLAEEIAKMINPPRKYSKIITKLRGLVEEKDIGALLFASSICERENKKELEDDKEIKKLVEAYSIRGSTLYNWLRSEDVFPLDIIPLIECKNNFPDEESFNSIFKMQWEQLIEFHPWRIFVSVKYSKEDLREEILRRIIFRKMKEVFVYSRRSRNKIAKTATESCITHLDSSYKLMIKNYKIGNFPALRIRVYSPNK